jgi:hypothetical protein
VTEHGILMGSEEGRPQPDQARHQFS